MGRLAIIFGVLLGILGVVLYALAEVKSLTALIPSCIGAALVVLGFLAQNDRFRMHAMHVAALLGVIGTIGGGVMGILGLTRDRPATVWGGSLAMGALCAVFVGLCVKSFIDARRARKQNPGT